MIQSKRRSWGVLIANASGGGRPVLLCAVLAMVAAAPLPAEMRPYIPPPTRSGEETDSIDGESAEIRKNSRDNEDRTDRDHEPVRAFPVEEFLAFLKYHDEQLEILSRSEEPGYDGVILGRLQRRLANLIRQGLYRFDRVCPLVFEPTAREAGAAYVRLRIACLPEHHRDAFAIRLYPGNALTGVRFASYELLRKLETRREFTGELRLVSADLREGFVPLWRWQGAAALSYSNALLETLRARYPAETESQLLAPATLRANTATLLRRLAALAGDANYLRDRDLVLDFRVLYPEGSWIDFRRSCPLQVAEPLRREPATELFRLELQISCLQDSQRLRPIRLLLPGHALREAGVETENLAAGLAPGDRIHARLKFRELSGENTPAGLQFLLVWDTIRNIRADLPLVQPKS